MKTNRVVLMAGLMILPFLIQADKDLIKAVTITNNKMVIEVNDEFKSKFLKDDFFAEYDEDIDLEKLDYSLVIMPFIMHVFSAVLISGEDYFVDSMDRDLFHSLNKLKKVMKMMYPKTPWKGNLIPRKVVSNKREFELDENHIALLYSGGLDSTASSLFHREKKQLLITAWGQWDLPLHKPELWEAIRSKLMGYAQEYGHTSAFIKSNYAEFFNHDALEQLSPEIPVWRLPTVENIGWAGLVAPILYLKGYKVLRIASSDTWCFRYPSAAHPFIDNNISYAGIRLEHDMFDYSRLKKIEYIASLKRQKIIDDLWLYVCQARENSNCCECSKCIVTMMGILAVGEHPMDYEFPVSTKAALKTIKKYLEEKIEKKSLSYTALGRFSDIQNKLKERMDNGEKIATGMEWLLDIDFTQYSKYTTEVKFQKKIQWDTLHTLFPDIEVPRKIFPDTNLECICNPTFPPTSISNTSYSVPNSNNYFED